MTNRLYGITFVIVLVLTTLAPAQTFTVLYNFNGSDGANPFVGVIRDEAGNLYGTTDGDSSGYGLAYKLDTAGNETVLHNFTGGSDGKFPDGRLTRDSKNNLYGITSYGGSSSWGTAFEIDSRELQRTPQLRRRLVGWLRSRAGLGHRRVWYPVWHYQRLWLFQPRDDLQG